jgi:threonine dehydratase
METQELTIADIRRARERLVSTVRRTPLERSRWLSAESGRDVFLKLDAIDRPV